MQAVLRLLIGLCATMALATGDVKPAGVTSKGLILNALGATVPDYPYTLVADVKPEAEKVATSRSRTDGSIVLNDLAPGVTYSILRADGEKLASSKGGETFMIRLPPPIGNVAPDIEFTSLSDGKVHKLSEYRGKVIIVEFWATWCEPCQKAMADLQTWRQQHPEWGDKVELLAISLDDSRDVAAAHVKQNGWTNTHNAWAGELGMRSMQARSFAVFGIPWSYVIDQGGKVAKLDKSLPEAIDSLLQATRPTTREHLPQ